MLVVAGLADEGQGGVHGGSGAYPHAAVGKVAAEQEHDGQADQLAHQIVEQGHTAVGFAQLLAGNSARQAKPTKTGAQSQ